VEEENWFFRITKYKALVYGWLQANRDFLSPLAKTAELENIILSSEDISVSRLKKNVPWGVSVPNDDTQVIYVWFEALLNYIFAVDEYSAQHFIQICGPDNLRFQGSLFQSILQSANLTHTKKLLVHGTVLDADGKKMSKSLGNVVDPIDQLNKYGLDAVRYYTLAGLSTYGNSSWSETDLIKVYNTELADDFGNLLARVLHLIDTKDIVIAPPTPEHRRHVDSIVDSIKTNWEFYEIQSALKETNMLVKFGNKYINDERPWEKDKDGAKILSNLHYSLCEATELYRPVLSGDTYARIKDALVKRQKVIIFPKLT
jgi:methionyl-tRNA synthetase